jgi:hypothetical protein
MEEEGEKKGGRCNEHFKDKQESEKQLERRYWLRLYL